MWPTYDICLITLNGPIVWSWMQPQRCPTNSCAAIPASVITRFLEPCSIWQEPNGSGSNGGTGIHPQVLKHGQHGLRIVVKVSPHSIDVGRISSIGARSSSQDWTN